MRSTDFIVTQNSRGAVTELRLAQDATHMNWVIDPAYLQATGYQDDDKLFGEFHLTVNGHQYQSIDQTPAIKTGATQSELAFTFDDFKVTETFTLKQGALHWQIRFENLGSAALTISDFGVWVSLAYIMFRDKRVRRNANQSAAVFPSMSPSYTKSAVVRRDNTAPNLGIFQTAGHVLSVGTYCDYTNRFFENVSPSLDGMLFHEFILAGGYDSDQRPHHDWIYPQAAVVVPAGQSRSWGFAVQAYNDQADFYRLAQKFGHPRLTFAPAVQSGQT